MQNQETIIDVNEVVDITYVNHAGIPMPVIFSDLETPQLPGHPKIVTRIFSPCFTEDFVFYMKVLGTITQDIEVRELENVKFMGEYPDKEGRKLQIWINKADCDRVSISATASTVDL